MYVAYFKQLMGENKRGIPELGLDFASFYSSVEGTLKTSNLMEDIQTMENKRILIKDMIAIRLRH